MIDESKQIEITDDESYLIIRVAKRWFQDHNAFDLVTAMSAMRIFTNETTLPKPAIPATHSSQLSNKTYPHIAFFCENKQHYTGGRYSVYMYALLLSQYTKVTFVTNDLPKFSRDFREYRQDNFNVCVSQDFFQRQSDNQFDVIVGVPVVGGIFGHIYAKRYGIPFVGILFESPNFVREFRGGVDADEEFWKGYKQALFDAEAVILPSCESEKYFKMWSSKFLNKKTFVIPPPINELVAGKYESTSKDEKSVVSCTRMADFKNPLAIIKNIPSHVKVHVIGKVWSPEEKELGKLPNVVIHGQIDDYEKFEIISQADVLIHVSEFEGAGMPPQEAFFYGKHVVAFDLPVLRERFGDAIHYVPTHDYKEFNRIVNILLSKSSKAPHAADILEKNSMSKVSAKLRKTFNIPKICAGMIVCDGGDYLEYAIESIYDVVDKIIIVEGAVEGYSKSSRSADDTEVIVHKLLSRDFLKKISFVKQSGWWQDKIEMQNEIASRIPDDCDYYVKIDSDEIWQADSLRKAIDFLENNKDYAFIRMSFLHFWTNFRMIAKDAGGKWCTKHPRIWRWKRGMCHTKTFNLFVNNKKDRVPIKEPYYIGHELGDDWPIFHFGWAKTLKAARKKLNYYKGRGIEEIVIDHYTNWQEGQPTNLTQQVRSWAELYTGQLPKILDSHPWKDKQDIRKIGDK